MVTAYPYVPLAGQVRIGVGHLLLRRPGHLRDHRGLGHDRGPRRARARHRERHAHHAGAVPVTPSDPDRRMTRATGRHRIISTARRPAKRPLACPPCRPKRCRCGSSAAFARQPHPSAGADPGTSLVVRAAPSVPGARDPGTALGAAPQCRVAVHARRRRLRGDRLQLRRERPPAWWMNLSADPDAVVHVVGSLGARAGPGARGRRARRHAHPGRVLQPAVAGYTRTVQRELPVVRLEPTDRRGRVLRASPIPARLLLWSLTRSSRTSRWTSRPFSTPGDVRQRPRSRVVPSGRPRRSWGTWEGHCGGSRPWCARGRRRWRRSPTSPRRGTRCATGTKRVCPRS